MRSELETETYDLLRFDRSGRGGGVPCFIENSISYNQKSSFLVNTQSIFMEIFLPKSKSVLIGILYRPPDKYDFVNCLKRTFSYNNVIETKKYYRFDGININMQQMNNEMFRN